MGGDFTVTVLEPDRAAEFEAIFGTTTVGVKSPFPVKADLPGHPDSWVYELDLGLITANQRARLVAHLAGEFDVPAEEVEATLDEQGVPIRVVDCAVGMANLLRWM
jgi:hypothetical protein